MYTSTLSTVKSTEHLIYLDLSTMKIRQEPYRAGQKSHGVLTQPIQTQIRAGVIDPAQAE